RARAPARPTCTPARIDYARAPMLRGLALTAALAGCAAPAPAPAAPTSTGLAARPAAPDAGAAFSRLRALVGDWEATTEKGKTIHVSYRLVSNESVLVETFGTAPRETLTVVHVDGARLVATHYCAQKNQPRLALLAAPDDRRFEFAFFDATNLP